MPSARRATSTRAFTPPPASGSAVPAPTAPSRSPPRRRAVMGDAYPLPQPIGEQLGVLDQPEDRMRPRLVPPHQARVVADHGPRVSAPSRYLPSLGTASTGSQDQAGAAGVGLGRGHGRSGSGAQLRFRGGSGRRRGGGWHLEAHEAVDDVEDRAEDVEEAVGEGRTLSARRAPPRCRRRRCSRARARR